MGSAAARLAVLLALQTPLLGIPGAAWAQQADVVVPNSRGDFASLAVPGPRGAIQQRHWLVVDPDPRGLACRDGTGRASLFLRPGAIVESDGGAAALLVLQGRPWLRVRVRPEAIQRDSRVNERGRRTSCWVRANRSYLAPILPDALQTQQ
ncbi:MAG: hypothetical protein ACK55X_08930 [Synechococcaceae cyanobacterium]|jgi:hypothetical protein